MHFQRILDCLHSGNSLETAFEQIGRCGTSKVTRFPPKGLLARHKFRVGRHSGGTVTNIANAARRFTCQQQDSALRSNLPRAETYDSQA
jgi:hypothetical protein